MIVLDIETVPLGSEPVFYPSQFEGVKIPANYKDPEKIRVYTKDNLEKQVTEHVAKEREKFDAELIEWKKGALKAVRSQIVCICAYDTVVQDSFAMASNDETDLLLKFTDWICWRGSNESIFCGHNVRFDLQMLRTHACLSGILEPLKKILTFDKWAKNIQDTMEIWAGVRYDDRTKLTDIAQYLGLEVGNGDTTGADIYDFYKAGRLEEIKTKCLNDVLLTYEVWKRIK